MAYSPVLAMDPFRSHCCHSHTPPWSSAEQRACLLGLYRPILLQYTSALSPLTAGYIRLVIRTMGLPPRTALPHCTAVHQRPPPSHRWVRQAGHQNNGPASSTPTPQQPPWPGPPPRVALGAQPLHPPLVVLLQHRHDHGVGRSCGVGDGEEVRRIGADEARDIGGGGSQACQYCKHGL